MAKLSVLIGGDDRELQAALRRASAGTKKFAADARVLAGGAVVAAAAAIIAATAAVAKFTADAMKAVDAQAKFAASLNTSVASMATLERAADLDGVSVEQLQTGMRKLAVSLGEAASGSGPAVDALKRLGLSATELAALPLDQRIALINERIKENIPLAEQAAVSADFFGSRAGLAMRNLSPETIKEAAEQTRLFGHALSDVDAKKVEMANDSISTIGFAVDGLWKQVSIKLVPILKKIGDEFLKAAKDVGGLEKFSARAFNAMIGAAGLVADAMDFVRRAAIIAADGIIIAFAAAEFAVRKYFAVYLKATDLATLGLSKTVKKWSEENSQAAELAQGVMSAAWDNIQETLLEPLPSEALKKFVADAEAAAQKAAEAATTTRKGAPDGEDRTSDKDRDALQKRLEKLREQFDSEDELSFNRREKELADIAEFEAKKLIAAEEAALLREDVEQAHWERIGEIHEKASQAAIALEKAKNAALRAAQENFMNNLAGLMNTNNKTMFEIGKKAALAQAAVAGAQAVMNAFRSGMETGGPWAPFVAAAYAVAAAANAANLINNIRKQQFGGGGGVPTAPTQGSSGISPQGAGVGQTAGGGGGGQSTVINLSGEFFSRDTIRRFIEGLNEEGSDGARFIVA